MAKEEKPNLEEIAQRLSRIEEDFKLSELSPRVNDAYTSVSKYTDKKGVVRYKHDFSKDPKAVQTLADKIFEALSYHVHLLEFNIDPGDYQKLQGIKNAAGSLYTDVHVESAFGLSREGLRRLLDKNKDNLKLDLIMSIIDKQIKEKYIPTKVAEIQSTLTDEHVDPIKRYITKKAEKHQLPDYKDKIKDARSLQELLPIYAELAGQIYGKKKGNK